MLVLRFIGERMMKKGIEGNDFNGKTYKDEFIANSDYQKFDDTLRMILDVTNEQKVAITNLLEKRHLNGEIVYGIHFSDAVLTTCLIFNYHGQHVHFVDGTDGGYAMAAKQLKAQLKKIK